MFWKKANSSALELLEKHERMLEGECLAHSKQLGVISQTLSDNWEETMTRETDFILSVSRGRKALRRTILDIKKVKDKEGRIEARVAGHHYQISSLFLRECWEYLKSDSRHNERIFLITGSITSDGTRVLSRMEQVKYDKQGAAYVSADKIDSHQKIISLAEDYGHQVLAVFHSHMSLGVMSTTPSSIDHAFMRRMDQIGCHCLGGIFSLDGYARFFTAVKDFEIEVYGRGVKKIQEDDSYKIFKVVEVTSRGKENV